MLVLDKVFIEPFSLFSISSCGVDLDYCDVEWFALEMNQAIQSFLTLYPSTAFQTPLLTMRATPFLLRNFPHSSRYNSHLN